MADSVKFTSAPPSLRRKRRLRNLLIDRRFQLKYSGYFVVVALFLSVSLGLILWRTSQELIEQSREAVQLGESVVERGRGLLAESDKVNSVVKMNIAEVYSGEPALMEMFQAEANKHDSRLAQQQSELERNSKKLRLHAVAIERGYVFFGVVIVGVLFLLVIAVGLAGVVVTHRVAGPIFKMKRLLRALAKGHFRVVARLRKGDELGSFFDAFNEAAQQLATRQAEEIEEIEAVLNVLRSEDGESSVEVIRAKERLLALRNSMKISLTTTPPFD